MTQIALLLGATGQDSSFLAEQLLLKGYEVHGTRRRAATNNLDNIKHLISNPKFYLHYADLETENHLSSLIATLRPDEIYHLAAQSDVAVSFSIPEYTGDVTGLGTTRLLEAVREFSPNSRIYFAGTAEMLGGSLPPQTEQTPFRARSPYAAAKIYGAEMCRVYREAYGMFICVGILGNHESERRPEAFVTRKITKAVVRIATHKQKILELGNLNSEKDWGYAPTYTDAMYRMLQLPKPDDFIIATGETHTVQEFVEAAFSVVGLDWKKYVVVNPKFLRPADTFKFQPDISKAKRVLGWEPKVKFKELVHIMVAHDLDEEQYTL